MTDTLPKEKSYHLSMTTLLLGVFPMVTGLIVIIGWEANSYYMRRIIDSPVPMNPATAMAFILLGIAVVIPDKRNILSLVTAILAAGATLKLCDISMGTSFNIDTWFFSEKLQGEPAFPNRMAPNAALNFFLLALGLISFRSSKRTWVTAGQIIVLLSVGVSLFAIVGYSFNIKSFYGVGFFTPMALITAVTFFITACGLLSNHTHEGILRFIFNDGPASQIARFILPISVILPICVGWLKLSGERAGLYNSEFGTALAAISNSIILFILISFNCYLLYRSDSKRLLAEKELQFYAAHDPLTGLNTRRILTDQLKRRISLMQRRNNDSYAVFYLDVDGLKQVNDQFGHQAGDELLKQVAEILKSCTRSSDTVVRIGGDEFIILLEENSKGNEIALAKRILEKMPDMFVTEGGQIPVGISIGIAIPSKEETDPDNIIRAADEALYVAKTSGKNKFIISSAYT